MKMKQHMTCGIRASVITVNGASLLAAVALIITPSAVLAQTGPGYALTFDGGASHVAVNAQNVPIANDDYTIEAWIKPDSMGNFGIIGWGSYGTTNQVNALNLRTNGLVNSWWGNDLMVTNPALAGTWHHVAATYDGVTRRIYLDGALVGTNNATGHNVTTRANLTIGRVDTNYFAGVIDEVRVWGEVRSQVQIQTNRFIRLAGNESGLNAYWRFDEGAGTAAADTAGPWNPGTLVNNPVWVRSSVTNAPEGVTSNATAITTASARLNGRVHAGNLAAKAWFQWGTTGNYGTNTPQVSFGPALPADTNTLSFECNSVLTNLTVNTTYYYRVAVTNSVGTNYGGQGTFTTAALPAGPSCALIFDGDNDYVEFNRPIADDLTLECWFNSTQIAGNEENWYQGMGLIDGEVGGHVNDLGLTLGAGKVLFGTGGNFDTTIRSEIILADGKWHHVAATRQRSSGAMLLYVDGELVASGTGSTYTLNSPATMRLGGIAAGGNFFRGQMDEVRIWNTVRSQVQIQANLGRPLAGNESGLVAYWKLDECEGSFVADTTGHGYDGALAGAAWTNSAVPYGPFVITLAATNLTTTTAALKGSANPGAFPSTAWFQWGATTNYGNATLITNLGAGANTVALTTNISGLASFNSYHFRAVAANVYGTNYGEDQTFWLGPPIVATLPAFGITTNAATLEGDVIASGPSAQAWFQWGTNTSYGNSTALISVGTGTVPVPVTNRVSGLIAGSIYHYRVGASNSFGTTYGADRTFTNAFVAQVVALTGKDWSALAWGDFDLDGDLDIVVSGQTGPETKLYRNDGGSFAEVSIPLSDVAYGSLAVNDYDNDGWLDILLTGSDVSDSRHTEVWRNTSTGWTLAASLTGVTASSAGWGDFDNDGRPDILLSGGTGGTNGIAQVWRNTGSGFVLNTAFPGLYWSSGAWGDYDNDGNLDILLAGVADGTAAGYVARLYHNNGDRTFTLVPVSLPGAGLGDATWGDYDNDGLLDILLTGIGTNGFVASVFHNEGNGTFVDSNAGLIPVGYSSAAWGDFDNDGWLDIALMGLTNASESSSSAFLYQNTGTGHFTLAPSAGLISCYKGAMAVGDYDKDGRLDIATSGYPYATRIYHNYWPTTNTPPTGPANLVATVLGTNAVLAWTAGSDSRTPGAGLTYNLRVGTAPGISNIVEPLAAGNGWRRVPLLGNLNHNLSAALTGLKYGSNYYWSVQAVDTSLAGSAFECGGLFSITLAPSCSEAQLGSIMGDSAIVVASVYPNGSATSAHIQWGSTTSYGSNTSPQSLGSGYGPVALRQLLTGLQAGVLYHYRIVTSNAYGTTYGPDQTFTVDPTVKVGDSNGDGVVDQSELDDVLAGYWPTSPWLYMTNTAGLGGANVTFALTNSTAGAYSVLMSTNLNDWQYLGPATPRYEFTDTNVPAVPQRYYRLRWP